MKTLLIMSVIFGLIFNPLRFDETEVDPTQVIPEETVCEEELSDKTDGIPVSEMSPEEMAAHCGLSLSDFDALAGLIEAESDRRMDGVLIGRIFLGLVVWNRVWSERFPNTVHDVMYQAGQFRLPNGRVPYITPTDYSRQAVVLAYDKSRDENCPRVLFYTCLYWFSSRPRYGNGPIGGNYFSL